mgnify:CR=1 FL=1
MSLWALALQGVLEYSRLAYELLPRPDVSVVLAVEDTEPEFHRHTTLAALAAQLQAAEPPDRDAVPAYLDTIEHAIGGLATALPRESGQALGQAHWGRVIVFR